MSSGRDLMRLQEVDTRIGSLRAEVAEAESLLRRDPDLERARAAAVAAERDRGAREQEATAAEAEVNALQRRIQALNRRLYGGSVHNPQDLLELQREVEVLQARSSEAEDRAIALLGEAETSVASERESLVTLQDAETRRQAQMAPLEARLAAARTQLSQATSERDSVAAALDPKARALYQRVAGRRSPAVVALAGDACGGCHLPLSIEERRLVRAGTEIVQCSNCDRILVP